MSCNQGQRLQRVVQHAVQAVIAAELTNLRSNQTADLKEACSAFTQSVDDLRSHRTGCFECDPDPLSAPAA